MLFRKYAPAKTSDVIGQKEAVEQTLKWLSSWKKGSRAALFFGPPGSGKTSLASVLALEKGLDFIELSASDYRKKDDIESIVGGASKQKSLFRKGKLIVIDEVDGTSGREDRGGIGAVIDVIKESSFPIILTANDPYDQKLKTLRNYCTPIKFGRVHSSTLAAYLKEIARKEGIKLDEDRIKSIAREAAGDVRAALIDLETLSHGSSRALKGQIFEVLKVIFKTSSLRVARQMVDSSGLEPDDIFRWVENNIPMEYEKPGEIAAAFDALSRADVFKGRIMRRQNWSLLSYYIDLTASVCAAKKEPYRKFTPYRPPPFIFFRQSNEAKKKLAALLHTSSSGLVSSLYMPLIERLGKEGLVRLGMSKEEAEAILG